MRYMLLALLLVLITGCAAPQREPYSVEAQTVTVHFLSESEWLEHTTDRTLNGSWAMPGEIRGTAHWETNDGEITQCEVCFPAHDPPSRELLVHELRHCTEGNFHR